jgi:hypothetical protein
MAAAASNNVRISHPSREEFWVEALFDAVGAGLGEILEEPEGKILLVGGELRLILFMPGLYAHRKTAQIDRGRPPLANWRRVPG